MLPDNCLENLDGMFPDELEVYAKRLRELPIVGNSASARDDCSLRLRLVRYAELKAQAMRERMTGNVSIALALEKRCDAIYDHLPDCARW